MGRDDGLVAQAGDDVTVDGRDVSWRPGTAIIQQDYWRGKLVAVRPVTVVEDSSALLALYAPAGAPCLFGRWPTARRTELSVEDRVWVYLSGAQAPLDERVVRAHVLTLNPPGAQHSFKLFWDRDWRLMTWYVNLEAPFLRTHDGITHRDLFLDLVVTPDLRWSWKDEDELEALCAAGGLAPEECARVRAEGQRMVERIESGGWPFDSDWPNWRTDWLGPCRRSPPTGSHTDLLSDPAVRRERQPPAQHPPSDVGRSGRAVRDYGVAAGVTRRSALGATGLGGGGVSSGVAGWQLCDERGGAGGL